MEQIRRVLPGAVDQYPVIPVPDRLKCHPARGNRLEALEVALPCMRLDDGVSVPIKQERHNDAFHPHAPGHVRHRLNIDQTAQFVDDPLVSVFRVVHEVNRRGSDQFRYLSHARHDLRDPVQRRVSAAANLIKKGPRCEHHGSSLYR